MTRWTGARSARDTARRSAGWRGAALVAVVALLAMGPAAGASEEPAPVTVTTRVEPAHVTVGTPFRYVMRVEAVPDTELIVPVLGGRLGDFLITDFGEEPPRTEQGRAVATRWYTLVAFEAGDHIIPGPTVQYRRPGTELQRVDPPDALIIVDSLLPATGDAGDIRGPKAPVEVPADYRPLWWALAGVAGLVAMAVGLSYWLNRQRRSGLTPPRPAHETALEALARLHAARLLEAERQTEYYVRLTDIVRTYLEGRFDLRAPEMTTEEFLLAAQRHAQLTVPQRSLLSEFLMQADLVKFARHVPTMEDAEAAYTSARQFVEATRQEAEVARAAA